MRVGAAGWRTGVEPPPSGVECEVFPAPPRKKLHEAATKQGKPLPWRCPTSSCAVLAGPFQLLREKSWQAPTHLVDPVRVEHAQAAALATDLLLGHVLVVARGLELRHALVHRLAVGDALRSEIGETADGMISDLKPSTRCDRRQHC